MNENLSAQAIHRKYNLPKIAAKKIEEANNFLNDPNSAIKKILSLNIEDKKRAYTERKRTKKQHSSEQKPKKQINSSEVYDMKLERELIEVKMKKFKPKNGSFSQLYGQQIYIEDKKQANDYTNVKMPDFNFKSKSNSKSRLQHFRSSTLQPQQMQALTERERRKDSKKIYVKKLAKIRDSSELLRYNSRNLQRKADEVSAYNQEKYEKLKDYSDLMTTGQQKYRLDEEFSTTYRKQLNQQWLQKKK